MSEKSDCEVTERNLCLFLKTRREERGISQREMADRLGYKNANFISIVENNKVRLPFAKFPRVVESYELPPEFLMLLVKVLYPDFWDMVFDMLGTGLHGDRDKIEGQLGGLWKMISSEPSASWLEDDFKIR